jgi:hypothetical protein
MLPVKYYIYNFVRLWSFIRNINRRQRFLCLHQKNKMPTKRPEAASKKFLHHIVTVDELSRLHESYKVSVFKAARGRNVRLVD